MVDAGRQGDQVPFVHGDADPSVLFVPDVEVGLAIQDVADLIVQVKMLVEEHLQLADKKKGQNNKKQSITQAIMCCTDLFLIVGKCVLVNGDDVHVGVALFLTDLLQLWVCFIDVSIQLQQQNFSEKTETSQVSQLFPDT